MTEDQEPAAMDFLFEVGHHIGGKEVDLVLARQVPADPTRGWQPAYEWQIVTTGDNVAVGELRVRLGYTNDLVFHAGHLGYGIVPDYRGRGYAAKACELTEAVFRAHGMDVVWITCSPQNVASSRTLERLGCEYVATVDLPEHLDMYKRGDRQVRRYRWTLRLI